MSILDWLFDTDKKKKDTAELYTGLSQDHSLRSISSGNIGLSLTLFAATFTNVALVQGWLQTHTVLSASIIVLAVLPAATFLLFAYLDRLESLKYSQLAKKEFLDAKPDKEYEVSHISYLETLQADIRQHPIFFTAAFTSIIYLILQLI